MPPFQKIKSAAIIITGSGVFYTGLCIYKGDSKIYDNILMPAFRFIDPEKAHNISLQMMKNGIYPRLEKIEYSTLTCKVMDISFDNPLGLAAGCDKNGVAIESFGNLNFGFVEIGSITPLPQEGNPKPRIFRLLKDEAVINRLGFNNDGFDTVLERLERYQKMAASSATRKPVLGINIGKNKSSESYYQDYLLGISKFSHLADYLVINISSPNTPGLRDIQRREFLEPLLTHVRDLKGEIITTRSKASAESGVVGSPKFPKILIKLSPDMAVEERTAVANIIMKCKDTIDGVIISNTTVKRPTSLNSSTYLTNQTGGLSGAPLKDESTTLIREFYSITNGQIPIIGVGGISSGADAYAKIKSGASLLQLYTGLLYHGPPLVPKILKELDALVKKDGYVSICQAVGKDIKKKP